MSVEEADHVMWVNFMSCVWTTLAVIPRMLRVGAGTLVNVALFAAKFAPPREAIYAGSKAAMSSFSEGLWNDLKGSNIHTVLIIPGPSTRRSGTRRPSRSSSTPARSSRPRW